VTQPDAVRVVETLVDSLLARPAPARADLSPAAAREDRRRA
jgi:hypothetical protein